MVAVEMGDEDHLDALDFLMVFAELGLGVFAAVDEDAVAADGDQLGAAVAGESGRCCAGAEDKDIEFHRELFFLVVFRYNVISLYRDFVISLYRDNGRTLCRSFFFVITL